MANEKLKRVDQGQLKSLEQLGKRYDIVCRALENTDVGPCRIDLGGQMVDMETQRKTIIALIRAEKANIEGLIAQISQGITQAASDAKQQGVTNGPKT